MKTLILAAICFFNANASTISTRFGLLKLEEGANVELNGKSVNIQFDPLPNEIKVFNLGETDAILFESSTMGTSCPAQYFFISVSKSSISMSPEFGSCSEASFTQSGNLVYITMAGYKGPFEPQKERIAASKKKYEYLYFNEILTENGVVKKGAYRENLTSSKKAEKTNVRKSKHNKESNKNNVILDDINNASDEMLRNAVKGAGGGRGASGNGDRMSGMGGVGFGTGGRAGWGTGNGGTRQGKMALGGISHSEARHHQPQEGGVNFTRTIPQEEISSMKSYLERIQPSITRESMRKKVEFLKINIRTLELDIDACSVSSKANQQVCYAKSGRNFESLNKTLADITEELSSDQFENIKNAKGIREGIKACADGTDYFMNPVYSAYNRRKLQADVMMEPISESRSIANLSISAQADELLYQSLDKRVQRWMDVCSGYVISSQNSNHWNPYFVSLMDKRNINTEWKVANGTMYSATRWMKVIYLNGSQMSGEVFKDKDNGIGILEKDECGGSGSLRTEISGDTANVIFHYIKIEDAKQYSPCFSKG